MRNLVEAVEEEAAPELGIFSNEFAIFTLGSDECFAFGSISTWPHWLFALFFLSATLSINKHVKGEYFLRHLPT